jgi:hypothetical protein
MPGWKAEWSNKAFQENTPPLAQMNPWIAISKHGPLEANDGKSIPVRYGIVLEPEEWTAFSLAELIGAHAVKGIKTIKQPYCVTVSCPILCSPWRVRYPVLSS